MNKKLIKILGITSCALGGVLSISSLSTSCAAKTNPWPKDLNILDKNTTSTLFKCDQNGQLTGFVENYLQILNAHPEANTIKLPTVINGINITSIGQDATKAYNVATINTLIVPKEIVDCTEYSCLANNFIERLIFESDKTELNTSFGNPGSSVVCELYYPGNSIEQLQKTLAKYSFYDLGLNVPAGKTKKVFCTGSMNCSELVEYLKANNSLPKDFIAA